VRASVNRGFEIVLIEDCCASISQEMHDWSIANIMPVFATVTSSAEVIAELAPRSPDSRDDPVDRFVAVGSRTRSTICVSKATPIATRWPVWRVSRRKRS